MFGVAVISCPNKPVICPTGFGTGVDPAFPIGNYSSEAPDVDLFIGRNTGFGTFRPPLGSVWQAAGCLGLATSSISQADADLQAANSWVNCISVQWPGTLTPDNPDGVTPGTDPPQFPPPSASIYGNEEQTAIALCPDGSEFSYTVEAGTYTSLDQAQSNQIAASVAIQQATIKRICMSELSSVIVCKDGSYSGTVTITDGAGAFFASVMPDPPADGLVATIPDPTTLNITGTPTASGDFNFTVRAENDEGDFMEKSFFITVIEILNATALPAGEKGTAYLEIFSTGAGGVSVVWSVVGGSIPPGLTLFPDGTLSGAPTSDGEFNFTVRATVTDDESGQVVACEKEFDLLIEDPVFDDLVWTEDSFSLTGTATGSWSPGNGGVGNDFTMEGTAPDTAGSRCTIQTQANMSYTGTGDVVPCKISLTVSNANGQLPDGSRTFVVRIPQGGSIVASISDADSKVDGTYEASFNLPATDTTVRVEVDIDVAQQISTTSSLTWSGSITVD